MQRSLPLVFVTAGWAVLSACEAERLSPTPNGGQDAGLTFDAGSTPDSGRPGAQTDAGAPDSGAEDSAVPDAGPVTCGFDLMGPPDAPRVMLLGHPFGAQAGIPGTEISSRTLNTPLAVVEDGVRVDVGMRVSKLAFVPSGAFAVALGERGELVSLRVGSARDIEVVDQINLPSADYGDLKVLEDGQTFLITGANGNPPAGLSTVSIGCEGQLRAEEALFFPLALADAVALSPNGRHLWVSGGQTLFEPINHDDVRVLERLATGGFREVGAYDVFTDFMSADQVAMSPDGTTFLVPNGLDFSNEANQLAILTVQDESLSSMDRITMNLPDLAEVLFSVDGQTIVATLAEPGQVVALSKAGGSWAESARLGGIGLADQMAQLKRGGLSDHVFVPSTDVNGASNVAIVAVTGPGQLTEHPQHNLGMGFEQIPSAIAIMP